MFRDRTEPTLFRAGTVPETVPVRSLLNWYRADLYRLGTERLCVVQSGSLPRHFQKLAGRHIGSAAGGLNTTV